MIDPSATGLPPGPRRRAVPRNPHDIRHTGGSPAVGRQRREGMRRQAGRQPTCHPGIPNRNTDATVETASIRIGAGCPDTSLGERYGLHAVALPASRPVPEAVCAVRRQSAGAGPVRNCQPGAGARHRPASSLSQSRTCPAACPTTLPWRCPLQDGNLESIPAAGVTYTVEMDMVLTRG